MSVTRLTALTDLVARLEFATTDELRATAEHLCRSQQDDAAPGVAALLEAYTDLVDAERACRDAECDRALTHILGQPTTDDT